TDVPTQVVARGEVAPDDLGIAVAHAGILLASLRESRSIAPSVFDALASGVPLITADTDAARELLRDGESAVLVPPHDPPALARAISRLAADDRLRQEIAESGLAAFQEQAARAVLGARWRELLEGLM